MKGQARRWAWGVGPVVMLLLWATLPTHGQSRRRARPGNGSRYAADLRSTRYAPLDQINAANFNKLEVAWRFKTDSLGPRPEFNLQATPLMVGGIVYTTMGTRRAVVALDAATGEQLWMQQPERGQARRSRASSAVGPRSGVLDRRPRRRSHHLRHAGLPDDRAQREDRLPVSGFGKDGIVDLKLDDDQQMDLITGEVGLHAAPVVAKDVIVIGAAHLPGGAPKSKTNEKGYVRGFDVRTGKRLWIFHTIPRPGEFGNDTWQNDSWSYTGNAGVWAQMSIDEETDTVFMPVELPTGDYIRHASARATTCSARASWRSI